jgi:hypothetical protein
MRVREQIGLFLFAFFAYMAVGSREVPWTDARRFHMVAESIVHRDAVDIPLFTGLQRDGKNYAFNPFLTSAVHVPGAALHKRVEERWRWAGEPTRALGSHIGPALSAALLCVFFAMLCRDLGASVLATNLSTVVLALGTMIGVYARSPYSEIVQAAAFMGLFVWLLRVARKPTIWAALWFGFWAGMIVNTKAIYVLSFPGAALFAGWHIYRSHGLRRLLLSVGWATLGALPGLAMMFAYNYVRTGSITNIGYPLAHQAEKEFLEKPLFGLMGLFLSPGKSLFLYSPPLIVSLLALPRALRSRPGSWFWAFLLTAGPVVWFYSRFLFWSGDWCWGSRYVLFIIPPLLLPAVFLLDDYLPRRRLVALGTTVVVFAAGLAVQVVGGFFYWDHFIRIAQDVQRQWLGQPQRTGATSPVRAGGSCDPCFEDFYGFNWLPALSPLSGHVWLLKHVWNEHTWEEAEKDAPWHRYTTLKLNFAGNYARARLDWWYFDWREGRLRPAGRRLLAATTSGALLSAVLWCWPPLRRRRRQAALAGPGPAPEDPQPGGGVATARISAQ